MSHILTINAVPETFESELPNGIDGDVTAIDRITVDNVISIEVDNFGEYEDNIDGEFTVTFNDGTMIQIDGYNGLWEIKSFGRLTPDAQAQLINDFRTWAKDIADGLSDN